MMKMKKLYMWIVVMWCLGIHTALMSQITITGRVLSQSGNNPLGNVSVLLQSAGKGTITNPSGVFRIASHVEQDTLLIQMLGYTSVSIPFSAQGQTSIDLGNIYLSSSSVSLREVNIISTYIDPRRSAVTVTSIPGTKLQEQLGDKPFPDVLKMVPGIYATRTGGGTGDAEVNIRGFKAENVGLLLNGVPISSVENGLIYWNNWTGLADIAQAIQVQRGMGASNVALNSVGGTINIVTRAAETHRGGFLESSVTSYGNTKQTLMLSSGLLENGMALTFLGSKTHGPGYVDATYVDTWAYFLSLSKNFNSNHQLVFTALATVDRHGQRNLKLSRAEIDRYGIRYNKDWGSYNGKINNASENFYHKPWITLNHYWNISPKTFLASSLYLSPGYGGGKWSDTYGWNNPTIFQFRNPSGQIDWQAIYLNNATHTDTAILANGQTVTGFSKNVQTHFLADHLWSGILTRMEHQTTGKLKYTAGLHLRQFNSRLRQKITDLLGGQFYIDDYSWAIQGVQGRDQIKTVGDIIKVHNGAINPSATLFGQVDYRSEAFNGFLSASVSNTWYQRWDKYNYVTDIYSKLLSRGGADIKAGLNIPLTKNQSIYLNGGFFSRAPYFKYVFGNFNNTPSEGLANEKVKAAEAGYRFDAEKFHLQVNAYHTLWEDKNFLSNEYLQLETNTRTRAIVTGLDAVHQGIEIYTEARPWSDLSLSGFLSAGDWQWRNDVHAILFNKDNVPIDTVNVYARGLKVGGAPQFQAGLSANLLLLKTISLAANLTYNDKLWANFDPTARNNPDDRSQAYQLPSYTILDLHAMYPFRLLTLPARFGISCFNVLDSHHIILGEDGSDHTLDTFRGFWDFGRTFNFSLRVEF